MEGLIAICEMLKTNKTLKDLTCAGSSNQIPNLAQNSSVATDDIIPMYGSLDDNQLCGLDSRGRGTYTAEGITKLCDALKVNSLKVNSTLISLRCA